MDKNFSLATRLIRPTDNPLGALAVPIFQTSTYENVFKTPSDYSYTRCSNPTRRAVEDTAASAEGGRFCSAFASGLAAINAVFALITKGEHILAASDIYGGTFRLLDELISKSGVLVSYGDASKPADFAKKIQPNTRLVFIETPTNPLMKVADIAAITKIAHDNGALLVVDNTFMTPVFQQPLTLGADIVVHSATKYLCGHHDVSAGLVITSDSAIAERIELILRTHGSGLSPFDCFLLKRGMETLCLRMKKHDENGRIVYEYLRSQPKIEKIYYIGDTTSPDYDTVKKQSSGFGGMLSFTLADECAAEKLLAALRLITFAESLGGNASLITHPYTQTHASVPEEIKLQSGILPSLLRLSVGTEEAEDIIWDLEQALSSI